MSRSAPHQLPARARSTVGRRSRQRRDNIENDLTTGLAFLPIQKQSSTNRKRLLTEHQSNATLNADEVLPKRHRLHLDDATAKSPRLTALPSTSNIPPLHRTLSDNSSYLNQTPLAREPALVRSQSTLVNRKNDPQSSRVGFESDDADDEDELSNTTSTHGSAFAPPATDRPILETTKADGILVVIDSASPECEPAELDQSHPYEDDLFGSDTTLTCPEDDSEEEDDDARTSKLPNLLQPPSDSPPSSPPARAIAVVIPARPIASPSPARRRGPGRPRKVTLPETTQGEPSTRKRRVKNDLADMTPRKEQPSLKKPKEQSASASSSSTVPSASAQTPSASVQMPEPAAESSRTSKVSGSLMSRVLDGAKHASDLADSDLDVSDAATQPECVQLAESLEMLREHILPRPDSEPLVPSDGNNTLLLDADSASSLIEIVLAVNELAAATAVENPTTQESLYSGPPMKDEFVVPAQPTERLSRAHASKADPLVGTSKPTIHKPTVPLRRNGPHPFVPRTCREIMTQHPSFSQASNILAIKSMLRHSLEQGLRKVLNADADTAAATVHTEGPTVGTWKTQSWMPVIGSGKGLFQPPPHAQEGLVAERQEMTATVHHEPSSAGTSETEPWMSVIGNGKGLFQMPLRKQQQQNRIAERRKLVGDMYRALELPPPPENWDKSSIILTQGLTSASHQLLRVDVRGRYGCDYCGKTYKHKNGLAYHMERCTMARLQTSISNDMDGDSTDSETEDQRNARCPTASSQDMTVLKSSSACSSEEDEDVDFDDEEGIIMCVCGSREDEGGMIQCDKCKVWLHLECVDLTENDVPEDFFCPPCQGLPTPSSGGKSFRHFPNKAKRRANARKFTRRARRTGSQDSEDDDDTSYEERSKSIGDDSDLPTNLLGSPQVTLNHVWDQPKGNVFKEKHAPALMLDGSLSQEINADLPNDLRYSDLSLDHMAGMDFTGAGDVLMPTELDLSFHDSQSFDYLPPTDPLFEPEYTMSELSISEASIDSDGLRTPIDLPCDMTYSSSMWPDLDLEGFVEETAEGFHLEHHQHHQAIKEAQPGGQSSVLLASTLTNWYYDPVPPRNDEFDPEGLVDLEACL
ncbi:myeloid lymphoid or mixed-lineage leukemia 5 (trithorax, ) [Mortierella alpina]|nr:myeloid lymphoid or mixed-lineage leukemia 5 (trithorax, ) [Mortierella alpina]